MSPHTGDLRPRNWAGTENMRHSPGGYIAESVFCPAARTRRFDGHGA